MKRAYSARPSYSFLTTAVSLVMLYAIMLVEFTVEAIRDGPPAVPLAMSPAAK